MTTIDEAARKSQNAHAEVERQMCGATTLGPIELADALRTMAGTTRCENQGPSMFAQADYIARIMEAAADALITKSADDAMAKHVSSPEPAPTMDELSLRVTLATER